MYRDELTPSTPRAPNRLTLPPGRLCQPADMNTTDQVPAKGFAILIKALGSKRHFDCGEGETIRITDKVGKERGCQIAGEVVPSTTLLLSPKCPVCVARYGAAQRDRRVCCNCSPPLGPGNWERPP